MPSLIILISGVRVGLTSRVREILRHYCTSHKDTKTNGRGGVGGDEAFVLLGSYSAYVGRRLPTFRGGLLVTPASANPLK